MISRRNQMRSRGVYRSSFEPLEARLALSAVTSIDATAADQTEVANMDVGTTVAKAAAKANPGGGGNGGGNGGGKPPVETEGNNLSFPVIWAEGAGTGLSLRGDDATTLPQMDKDDLWFKYWPTGDPNDPAEVEYLGPTGVPSVDPASNLSTYVYAQQGPSVWQATPLTASAPVIVDDVDWGDNLESVDWYTTSKVRTEIVLYKTLAAADGAVEYPMEHIQGLGIDELWGTPTSDPNAAPTGIAADQATVYSNLAGLTIQKLNPADTGDELEWNPALNKWTNKTGDQINETPLLAFQPVKDAADGPSDFSAEVNVKGKVIYGYTWDLKKLNEGAGDYRLTFSFDTSNGTPNTDFDDNTTIVPPAEEDTAIVTASESPVGGAQAEIDPINNITYIDITILSRTTGGGGGQKDHPVFEDHPGKGKPKSDSTAAAVEAVFATDNG